MRDKARSITVILLALLGVLVLGITSAVTSAIAVAATTALIMGGTGRPDPAATPPYIQNVTDYYIAPNTFCNTAACNLVSVVTPEEFFPFPMYGGFTALTFDASVAQGVINLDDAVRNQFMMDPTGQVVIFGYSQSATITTIQKRNFAANPMTAPPTDQLSIVVIGNPNRPNGGILNRAPGLSIPILGVTFNGPTPTDTGYPTTDIGFKYDAISDFPQFPINLLAVANALAGFQYVHGTFPDAMPGGYTPAELAVLMNDPANRQVFGDTTYITIAPKNLPIVQPLLDIGDATGLSPVVTPLVNLVQPILTVLIELGYDRTIPYGQPTTFGLFPIINPLTLSVDLIAATIQGVGNALSSIDTTPLAPLAPLSSTGPSTLALANTTETESLSTLSSNQESQSSSKMSSTESLPSSTTTTETTSETSETTTQTKTPSDSDSTTSKSDLPGISSSRRESTTGTTGETTTGGTTGTTETTGGGTTGGTTTTETTDTTTTTGDSPSTTGDTPSGSTTGGTSGGSTASGAAA